MPPSPSIAVRLTTSKLLLDTSDDAPTLVRLSLETTFNSTSLLMSKVRICSRVAPATARLNEAVRSASFSHIVAVPALAVAVLIMLCPLAAHAQREDAPEFTSPAAIAARKKRDEAISRAQGQLTTALKPVLSDVMKAGNLEEANRISKIIDDPYLNEREGLTSLRGQAAQKAFQTSRARADAEYANALKNALRQALRAGQLDESNLIAAEVERLEASVATQANSTPGFVNLLSLIDPKRDSVTGTWTVEKGALVSSGNGEERFEIPYEPPEEYDFQITFTKVGTNCVIQNLVGNQQPLIWVMSNSGMFTFHYVKGSGTGANKTTVKLPSGIADKRRYTSLVKVRKEGVEAFLNGKLVSKWSTDYSDVATAGFWALRNRKCLGVGAGDSKVTFHSIEVREVTGRGVRR